MSEIVGQMEKLVKNIAWTEDPLKTQDGECCPIIFFNIHGIHFFHMIETGGFSGCFHCNTQKYVKDFQF